MTAAQGILATPGHEGIAAAILWHLDWRSLLSAAATCRNLNHVVTSTSALQVELRGQYYGLPEWYCQTLKYKPNPPATITRLIDVQTRWAILSPKAIHVINKADVEPLMDRFGRPDAGSNRWDHWHGQPLINNGLFVTLKTALPGENALEERDPGAAPERSVDAAADQGHRTHAIDLYPNIGWVVADLSGSRNVSTADNLMAAAPSRAYSPGFRFLDIDVCREDNAIAILTARTGEHKPRLGGTFIYCRIHVYLAENDGVVDCNGVRTPVPHPEAHGVTEVRGLYNRELDEGGREWAPEWLVKLSPGGVVEVGLAARNGWAAVDWRTGQWLTHTDCEYDNDTLTMSCWGTMLRGEAQLLYRELAGDNNGEDLNSNGYDLECGEKDRGFSDEGVPAASDGCGPSRGTFEGEEHKGDSSQSAMTRLGSICLTGEDAGDSKGHGVSDTPERRLAVLRIEQALDTTHPFSAPTGPLGHPATLEGYAELCCPPPLLQEISRLSSEDKIKRPRINFFHCADLDPHGRLLAMPMLLTTDRDGYRPEALYLYAARLSPVRRMMEATAKPPTGTPPPQSWPNDWENSDGEETANSSPFDSYGMPDPYLNQFPDPDPPALTSSLTAQDIAPYSDHAVLAPSQAKCSVMGLRAINLVYEEGPSDQHPTPPPEAYKLYVANYAIPNDGDIVHAHPFGGIPQSVPKHSVDAMTTPAMAPQSARTNTAIADDKASFLVSAPWDWSHSSGPFTLSRSGVATEIVFNPTKEIHGMCADAEHLYLALGTTPLDCDQIVVLSF